MFIVYSDNEEDLSPGEFSPRVPVHSTAKKGPVGARVPKEPTGFARAYDLGEKCFADYVKIFLSVQLSLSFTTLFRISEFIRKLLLIFHRFATSCGTSKTHFVGNRVNMKLQKTFNWEETTV